MMIDHPEIGGYILDARLQTEVENLWKYPKYNYCKHGGGYYSATVHKLEIDGG